MTEGKTTTFKKIIERVVFNLTEDEIATILENRLRAENPHLCMHIAGVDFDCSREGFLRGAEVTFTKTTEETT